MTLWLQNPQGHVRAATINYQADVDKWYMSVTTIWYARPGDWYKSAVAAKRDFGKKFFKGARWGAERVQ